MTYKSSSEFIDILFLPNLLWYIPFLQYSEFFLWSLPTHTMSWMTD